MRKTITGFTLIELLTTVAIVAIIATIASADNQHRHALFAVNLFGTILKRRERSPLAKERDLSHTGTSPRSREGLRSPWQ